MVPDGNLFRTGRALHDGKRRYPSPLWMGMTKTNRAVSAVSDTAMSELVGTIYRAAMEPELWPAVARGLAGVAGVCHAAVGAVDSTDPAFAFLETYDISAQEALELRDHCLDLVARRPSPVLGVVRVWGLAPVMVGGRVGVAFHAGLVVSDGAGGHGTICLHQSEERGPVPEAALEITETLAPHLGAALRIHRWRLLLKGSESGAVLERRSDGNPWVWRSLDRERLARRYGLTERELAVCDRFVNLASVEATAGALGVEVSTIRYHLKSIYAKTSLRSLPALMRFLVENQRGAQG